MQELREEVARLRAETSGQFNKLDRLFGLAESLVDVAWAAPAVGADGTGVQEQQQRGQEQAKQQDQGHKEGSIEGASFAPSLSFAQRLLGVLSRP